MYFLPAVFGLVVYSILVQIRSISAGGFMMPNLIFHHRTLTLALEIVAHIEQLMVTLWRHMTPLNSRAMANKVLIIVASPTVSHGFPPLPKLPGIDGFSVDERRSLLVTFPSSP